MAEPIYRSAAYYSWRLSIQASATEVAARRARAAANVGPTAEQLAAEAETAAATAMECWHRSHDVAKERGEDGGLHGRAWECRREAERLADAAQQLVAQ